MQHERTLLLWQTLRHERLVAEADTARALSTRPSRPPARSLRSRTAAVLRAWAARLEPGTPERLA